MNIIDGKNEYTMGRLCEIDDKEVASKKKIKKSKE
jgi:hypothetical protein